MILGLLCAFAYGCSEDGSTAGDGSDGGDDSGQTTTPDDDGSGESGGGTTTTPTYEDSLDKVHELQAGETYDWDAYEVPAALSTLSGLEWVLSDQSDDFNYTSGTDSKSAEFDAKWYARYPQEGWTGPNPTVWRSQNSYVDGGALHLFASREAGEPTVTFTYSGESYTMPITNSGCISSQKAFTYPLYIETRAKVAKTTVASAVWMLSDDSAEEIDIIEAYGGDRWANAWFSPTRMHLSHHVFERTSAGITGDYQPSDEGSFYTDGSTNYSDGYHRVGVFWRDAFHLEYYIDGKCVRVVDGADMIDPYSYRGGLGLSQEEFLIFSQGDQTWRAVTGLSPTTEEIANTANNTFSIDWIRIYEAK